MKKFLVILILLIACPAWGATNVYVSPTGDNSDGLTWAKAKTTVQGAIALGGNKIINIDGGTSGITYNEALSMASGNVTLQGSKEAGRSGLVTINGTGKNAHVIFVNNTNITIKNLKVTGADTGKYNIYRNYGAILYLTNLSIDGGARAVYLGGTVILTNVRIQNHTDPSYTIYADSATNITLNYTTVTRNNGVGLTVHLGSSFTFNNCLFYNNRLENIKIVDGSSNAVINNSILGGVAAYAYKTVNNLGTGTWTVNNCILLNNPTRPLNTINNFYGVTKPTPDTNVYLNPLFIGSYIHPVFVVIGLDDAAYATGWRDKIQPLLDARGLKGVWAVDSNNITDSWVIAKAAVASGHEIAAHTKRHVNLQTFLAINISYAGACTLTINQTSHTLTTSVGDSWDLTAYENVTALVAAINGGSYTASVNSTNYAGNGSPLNLSEVSALDISTTKTLSYDSALVFTDEVAGSKADIESGIGGGYVCDSFVTPGGFHNTASANAIQDAGYLGSRDLEVYESKGYDLSGIDVYNVLGIDINISFGDSPSTEYVNAVLDWASGYGAIINFMYHGGFSDANLAIILDAIQAYAASHSNVHQVTFSTAMKHIRNVETGILPFGSTADNKTWTRTLPGVSNFHLQSGSPARGAGVDVGLSNTNPPDIGAEPYNQYVPWNK